jgi:hypothetical protein
MYMKPTHSLNLLARYPTPVTSQTFINSSQDPNSVMSTSAIYAKESYDPLSPEDQQLVAQGWTQCAANAIDQAKKAIAIFKSATRDTDANCDARDDDFTIERVVGKLGFYCDTLNVLSAKYRYFDPYSPHGKFAAADLIASCLNIFHGERLLELEQAIRAHSTKQLNADILGEDYQCLLDHCNALELLSRLLTLCGDIQHLASGSVLASKVWTTQRGIVKHYQILTLLSNRVRQALKFPRRYPKEPKSVVIPCQTEHRGDNCGRQHLEQAKPKSEAVDCPDPAYDAILCSCHSQPLFTARWHMHSDSTLPCPKVDFSSIWPDADLTRRTDGEAEADLNLLKYTVLSQGELDAWKRGNLTKEGQD